MPLINGFDSGEFQLRRSRIEGELKYGRSD
jgi:hypothetical protein